MTLKSLSHDFRHSLPPISARSIARTRPFSVTARNHVSPLARANVAASVTTAASVAAARARVRSSLDPSRRRRSTRDAKM